MSLDISFINGRIVDGTGAPWFRGSVGIRNGMIKEVSREAQPSESAERVIDLNGNVLAPGFIDSHSKSDAEPFRDGLLEPKIRQGITTEIIGHDGYSMAPFYRHEDFDEWERVVGGLKRGIDDDQWTWGSFDEYLENLASTELGPNVGVLVGHGTIRFNELGTANTTASEEDLKRMRQMITESLNEGALGISTGLVYTPQVHSTISELKALTRPLADAGGPLVAHIRSQGRGVWDAIDELYQIGTAHDIPVVHTHLQLSGEHQHGKANRVLKLMDAARERGIELSANQHPYRAGSTKLSALLPTRFLSLSTEELTERLTDPTVQQEIGRDIDEWRPDDWENLAGLTGWEDVVISSVQTDDNKSLEGDSVASIAERRDCDPVAVVCDLLIEESFEVEVLLHKLDSQDIQTFLSDSRISFCTDGLFGDHPHPRTYGTYPRILREYVRERDLLSLEEAVRKMTSLPAQTYGLDARGLIKPGMVSDLVAFNPETVTDRATYDDPTRYPLGINHVLTNGELVINNGNPTDNRPGTVLTR